MATLKDIISFCDERTKRQEIADFPGANNGLQLENNGEVKAVAAAVDGGLIPLRMAASKGIDLLIVHHGMFWTSPVSFSGPLYQKLKLAFDHNIALYSSHLPLDAHQEIGNNRLLADALGLDPLDWFLPYEGTPIALLAQAPDSRKELRTRLENEFPDGVTAMEFGSSHPERIAVLTGSGRSALPHLLPNGTDTLITGELRQEHFNLAQEAELNLYACGHYATERYGVRALAGEVAERFRIPVSFLDTQCPL